MAASVFDTAIRAYRDGQPEHGLRLARSGLRQQPQHEDLLLVAALCCQALARYNDAAAYFRTLAQLHPGTVEYRSNLGYMLRQGGHFQESEQAFQSALAIEPRHHDTLVNYGLLLLDTGHLAAARHRFLDAVDADPQSMEARTYAALACFECGDARRAEALIPPRDAWHALDVDLRYDLAMALIQVGRVEDAEQLLSADALTLHDTAAMARLAMLYERTNRIGPARELLSRLRTAMASAPRDVRVDALTVDSALALRDKDYPGARGAALQLLELGLPAQAEANACFNLAKIADKQAAVDEAMQWLARAHDIQFRLAAEIAPEIAGSADEPLKISSRWLEPGQSRFRADPHAPGREASPVFIVGYPRSGTTMLEQMLDAHPRFVSMDERATLQRCVELMEREGLAYPAGLADLPDDAVERMRALYWEEVARYVDVGAGRTLVDKNPLNMLRLPMIKRLFPDARVILALRHPCDVLLSCYMQNFRSPAFMVLCSTLERLAKSYVNAMRFWIHHQPLLFPDALLLRYEDTVSDFPAQVRRIAAFLGIDDADYLADFARHAAAKPYISTPSYSQVVEPVNSRAVARWHRYRAYFEPVLPVLQPVADHWGYALHAQ